MLDKKELEIIKRKFERLIKERKIKKPNPYRKEFFKIKAEHSLQFSKELVEKPNYYD